MKWALSLIGIGLACGTLAFSDIFLPAAAAGRVLFIGFMTSGAIALTISMLDRARDEEGPSDAAEGSRPTNAARTHAHEAAVDDALLHRRGSSTQQNSSM